MKDAIKDIFDRVYFQSEKLSKENKNIVNEETKNKKKEEIIKRNALHTNINKKYIKYLYILLYFLVILLFILLLLFCLY